MHFVNSKVGLQDTSTYTRQILAIRKRENINMYADVVAQGRA